MKKFFVFAFLYFIWLPAISKDQFICQKAEQWVAQTDQLSLAQQRILLEALYFGSIDSYCQAKKDAIISLISSYAAHLRTTKEDLDIKFYAIFKNLLQTLEKITPMQTFYRNGWQRAIEHIEKIDCPVFVDCVSALQFAGQECIESFFGWQKDKIKNDLVQMVEHLDVCLQHDHFCKGVLKSILDGNDPLRGSNYAAEVMDTVLSVTQTTSDKNEQLALQLRKTKSITEQMLIVNAFFFKECHNLLLQEYLHNTVLSDEILKNGHYPFHPIRFEYEYLGELIK